MASSVPPPEEDLKFTIAASTPHSGKYGPENILIDNPKDQSSRWSGAFQGNVYQWILLRLRTPAVLKSITFGKFSKQHPCNLKELKVFVGLSEDHLTEVLHAGLKNDSQPETFQIRYTNNAGVAFPTQYIKIVPILSYGPNFHVSIWHVSLKGITEAAYLEGVMRTYEEYREVSVLRHVLKHLRQRRLLTPYQSILSRANIQLEHPLVTSLHDNLVLQGDWSKCENIFGRMASAGLFDAHLHSLQPYANWTRLKGTDADGDGDIPQPRGGHAMCMDPVNEMIYLFGGWNGERDLDDFWRYSVKDGKWTMLSEATHEDKNAPGPRSCHKMLFDSKTGSIYLLGRLNDTTAAPPSPVEPASPDEPPKTICSEFYRYHTRGVDQGMWDFLSFDTASQGGPPLIFDHQMVLDEETQILYVFGGRVVDGDWDSHRYSGLYSYHIRISKWRQLQSSILEPAHGTHGALMGRSGHSMVLDSLTKTLYIFAGQHQDKYLSDMYAYDINTGIATELFANFSVSGGPDPCFTQRAVIDTKAKEIYVICGLTKNTSTGPPNTVRAYLSNWVYKYDTKPGTWMQILRDPKRSISSLPLPRYAHQVVYNPNTKIAYLHGGNSGGLSYANIASKISGGAAEGTVSVTGAGTSVEPPEGAEPERVTLTVHREGEEIPKEETRLDDFWTMQLQRPGREEIIRQATFQLRCQQFRELCEEAQPFTALSFLQKEVSAVVDHKNPRESERFRALMKHLISPDAATRSKSASGTPQSSRSPPPDSASPSSMASTSTSTVASPIREDTRESSGRPRKRPKPERQESGVWTNELEEDIQAFPVVRTHDGVQRLRDMVDPMEAVIRGKSPAAGSSSAAAAGDGLPHVNGARYGQRTDVFEMLLKYVMDGEKQPSESLLDLVDGNENREMY